MFSNSKIKKQKQNDTVPSLAIAGSEKHRNWL